MKLGWLSDIHLDSCTVPEKSIIELAQKINEKNVDAICITGDISHGTDLIFHLSVLEREIQKPIYFVAGNHDFWFSSFEEIRKNLSEVSNISTYLNYLSTKQYVRLSDDTCIIGHDGWYSVTAGNVNSTKFLMNDWMCIKDFKNEGSYHNMNAVKSLSKREAMLSAQHIHNSIKEAVRYSKNIIILTHIPPFPEACRYQGSSTDLDALPWYCNTFIGDVLKDAAKCFKNVNFSVLCGHTHSKYDLKLADNLKCCVAKAEYKNPQIQDILEI